MITRPLPLEQIQAEAYYIGTDEHYLSGVSGDARFDRYFEGAFVAAVPELAKLPEPPEVFAAPPSSRNFGRESMSRQEYLDAVRECRTNPAAREVIGTMAVALARYEAFRPALDRLSAALDYDPDNVPLFGQGRDASVYGVPVNGQNFAVHVFHEQGPDTMVGYLDDIPSYYGGPKNYQTVMAAEKAAKLAAGHGVKGLVQLAAFSPADGYCVSPVVPGKEVTHLTVDDISRITPQHIQDFIATLKNMQARWLTVDPNVGNLIWHPNNGITVLDYFGGKMSNADAGLALETLVYGIVGEPDSHGQDELTCDPRKVRASKKLLGLLKKQADQHFGAYLPTEPDDIIDSRTELMERIDASAWR